MLDIGFAELLVISAVALFVVGPERLPSAIRSISLWLGRVRRGFEEIKSDVSRELHNEEVMRALKESRDEVQDLTDVSSALSLTEIVKRAMHHFPRMQLTVTLPNRIKHTHHRRLTQTTRPKKSPL